MTFFLEDNKYYDASPLSESEVITECSAFDEALAMSEIAWNNITMQAMREEYATLNEGAWESIKNFFKKVIEWVKDLFRKIGEFLSKTFVKIAVKFGAMKKYLDDHKSDLELKPGDLEKSDVKVHDYKKLGFYKCDDVYNRLKGSIITIKAKNKSDKDSIEFDFGEIGEKIKDFISAKKVQATREMIKPAIYNLTKANDITKAIKDLYKDTQKNLKDTEKEANKGLQTANSNGNTNDIVEAKTSVTRSKTLSSVYSKASSLCTRVCTIMMIDAFKIVKQAAKKYKKTTKETDKKKKEAEKKKK